MSEEPQAETEGEKQEAPVEDTPKGDKPATASVLDEANAIYKRMAELKEEFKRENDRREDLIAREMFHGRTDSNKEEKVKEESPKDYAKRIMEP